MERDSAALVFGFSIAPSVPGSFRNIFLNPLGIIYLIYYALGLLIGFRRPTS